MRLDDPGLNEFAKRLHRALQLDFPHDRSPHLPPVLKPGVRVASVLALFDPSIDPALLLTRRTETVKTHKGQIAFPGGMIDPRDLDEVDTALRETEEEIGIPRETVIVVGKMPDLWTATGFRVTPVVGVLKIPRDEIRLRPSAEEIAEVFWAPLNLLLNPETYRSEEMRAGAFKYRTDVYQIGEHRVWGATAAMIKNLLDRLRALE